MKKTRSFGFTAVGMAMLVMALIMTGCENPSASGTTDAAAPVISGQPEGGTSIMGQPVTLTVTAAVSDSGTLSYQWYSVSSASTDGGTAISGATGASYSPPTDTIDTFYFYVAVTNTNNSVNGNKITTVRSSTAILLVGDGSADITVGFNLGAIAITGDNGSNVIYKNGGSGRPSSLSFSADGYTNVVWYVDASSTRSGATLTIRAADYDVRVHSVTFTGYKNGAPYSQVIPFTVLD